MDKAPVKTKDDIRNALEEFFDELLIFLAETSSEELAEVVDLWYGKVSKESVLLTMDNHLSHHRGQLVVYSRLLGKKPPSYIGW